jgi:hypothetical protein
MRKEVEVTAAAADTSAAGAADTSAAAVARTSVAVAECISAERLISEAVHAWVAVECGSAADLMLAAFPTWAAAGHISAADRTSLGINLAADQPDRTSAADQADRELAADRRACGPRRARVAMLRDFTVNVRSQRAAQTGMPKSAEMA